MLGIWFVRHKKGSESFFTVAAERSSAKITGGKACALLLQSSIFG